MSGRDELAEIIWDEDGCDWRYFTPNDTADAILAAGYRKPRTITTAEELVMVEPGTVIQCPSFHEETYKCTAPGTFHAIAAPTEYRPSELVGRGPFTVIYVATP